MTKLRAKHRLESIRRLGRNTSGATTIEYVILAALMILVLVAGLSNMAESNSGKWNDVADQVGAAHAQ